MSGVGYKLISEKVSFSWQVTGIDSGERGMMLEEIVAKDLKCNLNKKMWERGF